MVCIPDPALPGTPPRTGQRTRVGLAVPGDAVVQGVSLSCSDCGWSPEPRGTSRGHVQFAVRSVPCGQFVRLPPTPFKTPRRSWDRIQEAIQ